MKTIGLLGGMSWESTQTYYRTINQMVNARRGGFHSARIALVSVDFAEIETLQRESGWDGAAERLIASARQVESAGADFLLLCTNTMHKVADRIQDAINIPLLHIADATADEISRTGLHRVGLLGTRFTMEEDFYRGRLQDKHGIDVRVPVPADRDTVHRVIYDELVHGKVRDTSRDQFVKILWRLADEGAEGIVLGCTEIAMLVGPRDSPVPVFDTTSIHAQRAVDRALLEVGREI